MIREGLSAELLPQIVNARRSLVYLTVQWSGSERKSRRVFHAVAELLGSIHSSLDVVCFNLKEDSAWTEAWLTQLGPPVDEMGAPRGYGSLIWLEHGEVRDFAIAAEFLSPSDVVQRCESLWRQGA
ncbi:MAG TPA: hypothetical protein VGE52_00780 [Pirellulales bacterium]